jgi:ankyrin repeat protein
MLAIEYNNIEICKLLIEKGANIDLQTEYIGTALMFAIRQENIEITN